MKYRSIDLYEAFGLERPEGASGYLVSMCLDPIEQVNPSRRFPAVLIMAGGAYRRVSEREREPVAFGYLRRGFSVFMLDYSVKPFTYPTALREAVMAMLYIRENAGRFSLEPSMIAALGFSAGGHLLGTLAALAEKGSADDILKLKKDISPRPDAVIYAYPVITTGEGAHRLSAENISGGDERVMSFLSIEKHITPDAPPAFIWHTWEDATVPVKNSLLLAEAYERAGVPFSLHIFERGRHGLSTGDTAVYPVGEVPPHSADMESWLDMSAVWLAERGFRIKD